MLKYEKEYDSIKQVFCQTTTRIAYRHVYILHKLHITSYKPQRN